jgi:TRAP transporter TAXI family solute receptor
MPRLRVSAACLATLLLVLVACGGGDPGAEAPPKARFLSVGTAPPGGAFFVVGGALAEVLNAASQETGWQVTAEATKGTQENIRRLARGELDLALANAAITYFAVRGTEGWEQAHAVRSVITLAPNVAFFVAPRDGAVQSLADLRGKRVVMGPSGAGFEYFLRPILAAHGLTYDDFTPLNGTQTQAVDLLGDGAAAAAFLGGAIPTSSITQAATSQDVLFVPFDPEARQGLIAEFPFFATATVPADTYPGQSEPFAGLDVGSMHLIAAASADDELVYQVTRILYERRDQVIERHPAGRAINPTNAVRDTGTPFHPGAERYYREIGIWPTAEDAAGTQSE